MKNLTGKTFFRFSSTILPLFLWPFFVSANLQNMGAWYMYYWKVAPKETQIGFRGDVQLHSKLASREVNQLLLRGGLSYRPQNSQATYLLGYAHLSNYLSTDEQEHRIDEGRLFQEALFPQKISSRFSLAHRFRVEERWVAQQDFRSRIRYNLFTKLVLNQSEMSKGAVYLALYNEIFLNGPCQSSLIYNDTLFDRFFSYAAIGFCLNDDLKLQCGFLEQITPTQEKGLLQLSVHHSY
jgi:hypothetical protein